MVTVDRLKLYGFGRFQDTEFTLSPGLNVVFGGNEAGKSTVHSFIEAMLFGFWKPNLPHKEPEPGWEKYRPWQGGAYGGELEYTWSGGRVKVVRNFADNTVQVFNAEDGRPIADLPLNSWGEPDFARLHFGCNKLIFRNTISISQLGSATDTAVVLEVRKLLSNLAQSGGSGISAEKGLEILQEAKGQLDFELMKSRILLEQVKTRLAQARRQTEEAARLETEQYRLARKLSNLEGERRRLKSLAREAESRAAQQKLERLDELRRQRDSLRGLWQELSRASIAPDWHQQWQSLQAEIEKAEELNKILSTAWAEAQERTKQLEEQIEALASYRAFDKDTLIEMSSAWQMQVKGRQLIDELQSQLEALSREIREVTGQLSALPYFRPDTLEQAAALQAQTRVQQVDESHDELTAELDAQESKLSKLATLRWLLLTALPVTAAIAWQVQPMAALLAVPLLGAIIAVQGETKRVNLRCRTLRRELYTLEMEFVNSQRRREQAQRELKGLFSRAGVGSMEELEKKFQTFVELSDRHRDLLREQKYLTEKLESYRQESAEKSRELAEILASVGLDDMAMEEALACFRVNLDKYLDARMFLAQCQEQEEAARLRARQAQEDLAALQARAQEMMAELSVQSPAEVEKLAANYTRSQELQQEIAALEQRIQDMLEGSDEDSLREQAAALPPDAGPASYADIGERLEKLDSEILALQAEKSEGLGQLKGLYSELPSLAELTEELWQLEARHQDLELSMQALELAQKTILDLAQEIHSQLAPELNVMVSSLVERITGGKYNELQVESDMSINVLAPERGDMVDLSQLSGGTVDQFYFACRVAIADLVTGGDLPLFLDDSFVQYDDRRLRSMLSLLVELGRSRQIILLTCQRRELNELAQLAPGRYRAIDLENMG